MVPVAWFEHWVNDTSGVVRTLVQWYQWRSSNIGSMISRMTERLLVEVTYTGKTGAASENVFRVFSWLKASS